MGLRQRDGRAIWPLWLALITVLAVTLPFAHKAIHIDDVYFIEIARNVLKDPLRPFAGATALEDDDYRVFAAQGRCPNTFESMSHPPLVPYALAAIAWLAGGFREGWLHAGFAVFPLLAAAAMHSLARRFTQAGLAATLLLISSPIFMLSAQGLMTDMPTLALSLGGLAFVIGGVDREERWRILLGGVLLGLAAITRYAALVSVLVALAYGAARGRLRRTLPAWIGLAAVLGLWAAQNLACNGQLHILASVPHYRRFYEGQSFDWVGLVKKTLADVGGLGGTAFAAAWLLYPVGAGRRAVAFGAGVWAAAMVFVLRPAGMERLHLYSTLDVIAVAACFGCGLALLTEVLWPEPESNAATPDSGAGPWTDRTFLVLWLVIALAAALLLLPFGTARYMLPVLPPLWLLWVRRVESVFGNGRAGRLVLALAVSQGCLLGGVMALSDAEHAGRYREVALTLRANHPGKTLWFVGEWGFRYYMGTVGGRYLRSDDDAPRPGDLIVRPSIAGMHDMSAAVRRRVVRLQEIALQSRWPIRLMNFDAKAGYYSHHWGYLPWAPSHADLERIEIFEVRTPGPPPPATLACPLS